MKCKPSFFIKAIIIILAIILHNNIAISQDCYNIYITTTPAATLYQVPNGTYNFTKDKTHRESVSLNSLRKTTIHKPCTLPLLDITNSTAQFHYDTYIVLFRNKYYYLQQQFVANNSYLDSINTNLDMTYAQLQTKRDSIKTQYENAIKNYNEICHNKIDSFRNLIRILPNIDSVKQVAISLLEEHSNKEKDKYLFWYNNLPQSTKRALKYIEITTAQLESPNSAGGCDYLLYYTNTSSKTIKYLNWSGQVYNAVNDPVFCEIRNTSYVGGRDTGPIEPGQTDGGLWSCVIYNFSAREVRLSSIDIQYMDNSFITINGNDIKRMLSKPQEEYISWSQKDSIVKEATLPYKLKRDTYTDSLNKWLRRQSNINQASKTTIHDTWFSTQYDSIDRLKQLSKKANIEIIQFETFNNTFYNSTNRNINTSTIDSKHNTRNKKISFGLGIDGLMSSTYMGTTVPLEVIFGNLNQLINFSIDANYTYLTDYLKCIPINQLGAAVSLHFNIGKSSSIRFPLSIGIGFNAPLGEKLFEITGIYYSDFHTNKISCPLFVNRYNISSFVSWGVRWNHFKIFLYGRFHFTKIFNKSQVVYTVNEHSVFYDKVGISNILESNDHTPLFGIAVRYYF